MNYDLTCIITGHHEGRVAVPSLTSFEKAIVFAEAAGYKVERLYFLDRPNDITESIFKQAISRKKNLHVVDFGDQGHVRNQAVGLAKGKYCAFLDADDLWSEDWLVQALEFLADTPDTHIAHPAYNYFFEQQATIFTHVDQESPEFTLDLLRVANYWDALCVCPTAIYLEHPFYMRDVANGWAYEDWYWNCETVASGKIHKVVPNSVLFKRRQKTSQTIIASSSKTMTKKNPLNRYDNPLYDIIDKG